MITTFEIYTHELTKTEIEIIMSILFKILITAIGKEKAITNKQITRDINERLTFVGFNVKTSESRIRYMIHILRTQDIIPCLIATQTGYFISNNQKELDNYIISLEERSRAILSIRNALKRQIICNKKLDATQETIIFKQKE
jgi:hypothetical protein